MITRRFYVKAFEERHAKGCCPEMDQAIKMNMVHVTDRGVTINSGGYNNITTISVCPYCGKGINIDVEVSSAVKTEQPDVFIDLSIADKMGLERGIARMIVRNRRKLDNLDK